MIVQRTDVETQEVGLVSGMRVLYALVVTLSD